MKKLTFIMIAGGLMFLSACSSGSSKEGDSKAENSEATEATEAEITADASNASQPYAEFVDFGTGKLGISGGHMIELTFKPKIKSAANIGYDNDKAEVILLDGSGAKLCKMHPFGRNSTFEEAFFSGDELYKDKFVFIESSDTDEEAQEIFKKAKSYTLVMPLKERPVNKYADWDPVGTYDMVDAEGVSHTLIVKKGGSAQLINNSMAQFSDEYEPTNGSWTKNSEEGFLKMSFFAGPFISIADHMAVTSPVLTPEYFYYDEDAYRDDKDCLEVKKTN